MTLGRSKDRFVKGYDKLRSIVPIAPVEQIPNFIIFLWLKEIVLFVPFHKNLPLYKYNIEKG